MKQTSNATQASLQSTFTTGRLLGK